MKKKKFKINKILYFSCIFVIITLIVSLPIEIQNRNTDIISNDSLEDKIQKKPNSSASQFYTNVEWFENTNFSTGINPWYNTTEQSPTDIKAGVSLGQADFLILGDEREFSYVANFSRTTEWTANQNPYYKAFPEYPDSHGSGGNDKYSITNYGFWTQHQWDEGPRQEPSIQWVHEIEMPVNMSDYEIESANVSAIVNASVSRNIDVKHISDSPEGDTSSSPQGDIYDFLHFYVRIAKPNYDPVLEPPREIAWNRTKYLGLYNASQGLNYTVMQNTYMNKLLQDDLIDELNFGLSKDFKNFTIIVGIDIHSEDNCNSDTDNWNSIYINSFTLNFTYRKKIDQFASVSWNQIGNMINYTYIPYFSNVRIDNAKLNFNYKINQTWPSESFNSEIKFLINNVSQVEFPFAKLRSYNYTELQGNLTEARLEGYDITNYIPIEENITLSIQVLMLDGFNLDRIINISIDDIYFVISYTVFTNPPPPDVSPDSGGNGKTKTTRIEEPWINLLIAIAAIAGSIFLFSYLVYYTRVLKYPKPVRKVRKYRRTLKKKEAPKIDIISREIALKSLYYNFLKDKEMVGREKKLEVVGSVDKLKEI